MVGRFATALTDVGRHGNHVFRVFSAPKVRLVDYSLLKRDEVSPATTGDGGDDMVVVVEDNCTMLPAGDMVVVEDISCTIVIPAGRDKKLDVLRDIPIPRKGRAPDSSELLHSSVPWRLV
jgi:hypothetical protein